MNFKVGQKVVCIKNHRANLVRRGEIYTVLRIDRCCKQIINTGVPLRPGILHSKCPDCDTIHYHEMMFAARLFAPIKSDTCHNEIIEKFKSPEEQPDIIQIPHEEEV